MSKSSPNFIAPAFGPIALTDRKLAEEMTAWLYADPRGNPSSWDKPELWVKGPRVQYVKRTARPTSAGSAEGAITASGGVGTVTSLLFGGQNALVYSRRCTIGTATAPNAASSQTIPMGYTNWFTYSQQTLDGFFEVQTTALNNVFGVIPAQGYNFTRPLFWNGNYERVFTVVNNSDDAATTWLVWVAAILDTGR